MLQHIKSTERYHADHGWRSTWHHFSFNDYFDPDNVSFGALRVCPLLKTAPLNTNLMLAFVSEHVLGMRRSY